MAIWNHNEGTFLSNSVFKEVWINRKHTAEVSVFWSAWETLLIATICCASQIYLWRCSARCVFCWWVCLVTKKCFVWHQVLELLIFTCWRMGNVRLNINKGTKAVTATVTQHQKVVFYYFTTGLFVSLLFASQEPRSFLSIDTLV